jgi:hypothetical protein
MSLNMLTHVLRMRREGNLSNRDAQRLIKKTLGDKDYSRFVKPDYDKGTNVFDMVKFQGALNSASSGDSGEPNSEAINKRAWEKARAAPKNPTTGNIAPVSVQVKHLDKTIGEPSKVPFPYNQRPSMGFKERVPSRSESLPPRTFDGGYQTLRMAENPYDKSVDKKKKSKGAGKPKGLLLDDEQKQGLIY